MGDVINYPDVPEDNQDGHADNSVAEDRVDEFKRLFLKFKKEAEENKEIRDDELDIPFADEDTIRRLEAEGNGMWATADELAHELMITKRTALRKIRRGKWKVKKTRDGRPTGYRYLIRITDPQMIEKINGMRNKKQKKLKVKLTVSRPELSILRDMHKIDEETFRMLLREGNKTQFQFQFLVPEKMLYQVFKKGAVLPE